MWEIGFQLWVGTVTRTVTQTVIIGILAMVTAGREIKVKRAVNVTSAVVILKLIHNLNFCFLRTVSVPIIGMATIQVAGQQVIAKLFQSATTKAWSTTTGNQVINNIYYQTKGLNFQGSLGFLSPQSRGYQETQFLYLKIL